MNPAYDVSLHLRVLAWKCGRVNSIQRTGAETRETRTMNQAAGIEFRLRFDSRNWLAHGVLAWKCGRVNSIQRKGAGRRDATDDSRRREWNPAYDVSLRLRVLALKCAFVTHRRRKSPRRERHLRQAGGGCDPWRPCVFAEFAAGRASVRPLR